MARDKTVTRSRDQEPLARSALADLCFQSGIPALLLFQGLTCFGEIHSHHPQLGLTRISRKQAAAALDGVST